MNYENFVNNILSEDAPVAILEDWYYGVEEFLGSIGLHSATTKWKLLETFSGNEYNIPNDLEFRQLNNNLNFVLGYKTIVKDDHSEDSSERFKVVFRIDCTRKSTLDHIFETKKIIKVNSAAVLEEYRDYKISLMIYKFLVEELGYAILSDSVQFNGARRLWARLSRESSSVTVDVVDVNSKKIVDKNVTLNHGIIPTDYDRRVWSQDNSKADIRFLLKAVNYEEAN